MIWRLILSFFILGIVGDDEAAEKGGGAADGKGADAGADDGADDNLDLEADDAAGGKGADDDTDDPVTLKAKLAEARKAHADAEKRAKAESDAREEAVRRATPPKTGQTEDERQHDAEEARLRDPKTTELQRWQIEANRKLRANERAAQTTLLQAQDMADRTAFAQLATTKPALYKRYNERVEQEVAKMRERGQNAPREAILRFLIGEDALQGKFTKKPAAEEKKTVERGKSPGARSDVNAEGAMTEHQKRAKRLDGVIL